MTRRQAPRSRRPGDAGGRSTGPRLHPARGDARRAGCRHDGRQSAVALLPHPRATSDLGDSTCPLATRRAVGACLLSALQHTYVPERRVFWHAGPLWNSGRLFLCPTPGERHRARTSRVRAHGPPRSGQRRIDLDASLAETVTVVQAWAARKHIALRGDEPDAPTLRLWGDAPAGRHGPDLLTDPAAFLPCLGFLASARLMPFGLSALVYPCAGLWCRSCHRRRATRRRTGGFGHPG
jgi:hypothetical protein